MTDKKSSESRRKLLKSVAAGSGAVFAGSALPKKWAKPVVDSVMLPAHAQTSACATIIIQTDITVDGVPAGGRGYNIFLASSGSQIGSNGGGFNSPNETVNDTWTETRGPGQYFIGAGFGGDFPTGRETISGTITVSCCNGETVTIVNETLTGSSGNQEANGCALVTLGEDGTCMVELSTDCPILT